jgi:predicted NodU family carbamoyl transferase
MTARYTVGLNIGFHDASAALVRDGALRWLIEEERVTRKKHALAQPPVTSLQACLDAEGITIDAVDEIAIGWDFRDTPLGANRRFSDEGLRRLLFPDNPPERMPPITWVPHHIAHAASAYYSCGRDDVAILVVDGAGETQSATIARGRDGEIEVLRQWPVAQSLGFFYTAASKWAGFGDWGTGKLMGLAAYGRPQGGLPLRAGGPDGYEFLFDTDGIPSDLADSKAVARMGPLVAYYPAFERNIRPGFCGHFPYAERTGEEPIAYADFAATVQTALEDAMFGLIEVARAEYDLPTLVLAGGVAMNCTMVGRLARSGLFENVYVPPVPTDAGVSLGAALVAARRSGAFHPTTIDHAYWAADISGDDAVRAARSAGLAVRQLSEEELTKHTAQAIADGKIIGWARGRAEIGQRALGTRSILADPRDRRSLERLNILKGREMWRPVAPSILGEYLGEVMETEVGHPARFMLAAGSVRPAMRQTIPAVSHVDGSARPQLVDRATNPAYWSLVDAFRQVSGVPLVVNTSFNLADEPIVHTAADAVRTFVRGDGLDLLVLDRLLVARSATELP